VRQIIGKGRPEDSSDQGTADAAIVESNDASITQRTDINPVPPAITVASSTSSTSSEGGVDLGLGATQGPLSLGGENAPQPASSRSLKVALTVPSTYVSLILPSPKSSTWCPIRGNVCAKDDLILR
jgi:hypothetical protein